METINITVYWSEKNYCAGWGFDGVGAIAVTGKTLDDLKNNFAESLRFHVENMVADGEDVPAWLANGDYIIKYDLATSALLREAERYTTMAVISRVTGINQKQLSHYASNLKQPREKQRLLIAEGMHKIAQSFMALC